MTFHRQGGISISTPRHTSITAEMMIAMMMTLRFEFGLNLGHGYENECILIWRCLLLAGNVSHYSPVTISLKGL